MPEQNKINDKAYWNGRFSGDWDDAGGPRQSQFFARLALEMFPDWLREELQGERLTLCDWGCAEGDGTWVLADWLGNEQVSGIDFAENAIETAQSRYPEIRFRAEDLRCEEPEFDVLFSSNVLEHFANPFEVLERVGRAARRHLVALVPFEEENLIDEHEFRFTNDNIPILLGPWTLRHARPLDVSNREGTCWTGQQMLLVYSRSDADIRAASRLSDFCETSEEWHTRREDAARVTGLERRLVADAEKLSKRQREIEAEAERLRETERVLSEQQQALEEQQHLQAEREQEIQRTRQEVDQYAAYLTQRSGQLAAPLLNYRMSKSYKLSNLIAAGRRQPIRAAKAAVLWSMGRYQQQGIGLTTAAGASDPLRTLQAELESLAHCRMGEDGSAGLPRNSEAALGEVVIFAGVPYDDVGGGQRSAQLTRALLRRMMRVTYLYAYPRVDVATGAEVFPEVNLPRLRHGCVTQESPEEVFRHLPRNTVCIFELPHPEFMPFLEKARTCGIETVFELIDDWDSSLGAGWFTEETLEEFARLSDRSIGTARCLVERLAKNPKCHPEYLPNAAEETVFDTYKKYPRPVDYPRQYRQTVLYFGSLYGEWFAWDYLKMAAERNPHTGFVMIGERPVELESLPANVEFLGSKQNPELPAYLAAADATIIPFRPGRITRAVSPIKAFEYLFLGKPIISTRMEEITDYPGVVQAESPEEFARLCGQLPGLPERLDDFISQHSWSARADVLLGTRPLHARYSVITLIHNNAAIIERHLETLLRHTHPHEVEVIVVDNASHDDGPEIVRQRFPQVKLVRNPQNGCACGRNLGVAHAHGDVLVFFDSDQWFTSAAWLYEADFLLSQNSLIGALGWAAGWFDSASSYLGGPVVDYLPERGANAQTAAVGYRTDVAYLGSGGMFVPRRVWDLTEGFDEAYDPTVLEDSDLSFQIRNCGFDLAYRDLTGIRHQPHQTTRSGDRHNSYMALLHKNSEYFKRKWSDYSQWWQEERRAA